MKSGISMGHSMLLKFRPDSVARNNFTKGGQVDGLFQFNSIHFKF